MSTALTTRPATRKALTTHADVEAIQAYINGDAAELTPALQRQLRRLEVARDLLAKYGDRRKVVGMLLRLGTYTEMGARSQATAYRDVADCLEIFGTLPNNSRDFWVDRVLGMAFETREKAIVDGDLRAAAACDKNIISIIEKFMGDKELVDWSKVQPPRTLVAFMPELLGVPLPENLDQQVQNLLKAKKAKSLTLDTSQFEEAKTEAV